MSTPHPRTGDRSLAAIDLGATSGRVIVGSVHGRTLRLEQVARFPNTPVRLPDGLHWDVLALYSAAISGLGTASRAYPDLLGAAVDSWAVDYGLLQGTRLLGNPYHYRDTRTATGVAAVHAEISATDLYRRNGLQHLPFNTLFQLAAAANAGELDSADRILLIPDLIGYWATGIQVAERTNATTTGLVPVHGHDWDYELLPRLNIRRALLPDIVEPGTTLGPLHQSVAAEHGINQPISFSTVGSHDTASAVAAIPMNPHRAAYISCGTWSLVGAELARPITTDAARTAGFTNEGGIDGRVRFLKNVMGLWLLTETLRTWQQSGPTYNLGHLLQQAAAVRPDVPVFDATDTRLLAPPDMPRAITELIAETGQPVPDSPAEFVRSVLQSLADAYARTIQDLDRLTGQTTETVHLVGGGAQNALLCQLTANTTGLPVMAGPIEATAIGNVLIQARTHGLAPAELDSLRDIVAKSFPPHRYAPRVDALTKG